MNDIERRLHANDLPTYYAYRFWLAGITKPTELIAAVAALLKEKRNMTTRITVKNENVEGLAAVEVDYVNPLDGTPRDTQILVPGAEAEFLLHSAQSVVINEVEQPK